MSSFLDPVVIKYLILRHDFSLLVRAAGLDKLAGSPALFRLCFWCSGSADVAQSENGIFWLVFRFLYKQLLLFIDADPKAKESCIFESSADSQQLQLKPGISLHLYTNHCPEGAAKNLYFKYSSLLLPSFKGFQHPHLSDGLCFIINDFSCVHVKCPKHYIWCLRTVAFRMCCKTPIIMKLHYLRLSLWV